MKDVRYTVAPPNFKAVVHSGLYEMEVIGNRIFDDYQFLPKADAVIVISDTK